MQNQRKNLGIGTKVARNQHPAIWILPIQNFISSKYHLIRVGKLPYYKNDPDFE